MAVTWIKRTDPHRDEVTLRLWHDTVVLRGEVAGPSEVDGRTVEQQRPGYGQELGAHQALAQAIDLSKHYRVPVGVIDDEGLWNEQWGTLLIDG
jgi:hypothetical protein